MDDLIVRTFRRLSERDLQRLARTLVSTRPLHKIWHFCINTTDARLISEFMALANRIEPLRSEVISHIEETRRVQVAALRQAMKKRASQSPLSPVAAVLLATSLSLTIVRETELGVTTGHNEVAAVIRQFLSDIEPPPQIRLPVGRKGSR